MKKIVWAVKKVTVIGAFATLLLATFSLHSGALAQTASPRWTGCYGGLQFGQLVGLSNQSYGGNRAGVADAFFPAGAQVTSDYKISAPIAGLETGCNYFQTGNWLLGFEVDASLTDAEGNSRPNAAAIAAGANPSRRFTTEQDWLVTARSRVGYVSGQWLGFVSGGIALAGFKVNNDACQVASTACRVPTKDERLGWTVGMGAEYMLGGGWSAKSELLYVDFGKFYYSDSPAANGCIQCYSMYVKTSEVILRLGVNYNFNTR